MIQVRQRFLHFFNDLIDGLNELNKGIKFDANTVCCFTYADDVLLLAKTEADMEDLHNFVHGWCRKWDLIINFSKTNAMQF